MAAYAIEQTIGGINLDNLDFMESTRALKINGKPIVLSRCGFTGEDGFEISID